MTHDLIKMVDYIRTIQKRIKYYEPFETFSKALESFGIPITKKGFITQSKKLTDEQKRSIATFYTSIRDLKGARAINKYYEENSDLWTSTREKNKELFKKSKEKKRKVYKDVDRLKKTAMTLIAKSNRVDLTRISDDFLQIYALSIGNKFEEIKKNKEEYACDTVLNMIEDELSDYFSTEEEQALLQADYMQTINERLATEEQQGKDAYYSSFDF